MLTSPLRQLRILSRLFGLPHLLRVKRKHDEGLRYVRGYVATSCLWTLFECGFLDALDDGGSVSLSDFAAEHDLDLEVLTPMVEYLDGISILRTINGQYALDEAGRRLLQEPRGLFDLLRGYQPVFEQLTPLVQGRIQYGDGVTRDGKYVAQGSGELGAQFPFPIMRDLMQTYGKFKVLDLGCGDLEFLFLCCEDARFECWGIDKNSEAIAHAQDRLLGHSFAPRVHVRQGDMFALGEHAADLQQIDALCAIDVFHEYLWDGPDRVLDLLKNLRAWFPGAWLFVAEFCRHSHEWLRKHPNAFLEHEVCHALTKQRILDTDELVTLFTEAGYEIVEPRVFPMVGHGYFALR